VNLTSLMMAKMRFLHCRIRECDAHFDFASYMAYGLRSEFILLI
jgi:hypothetical protein